jgi:DDE superfamily endonuclease
VDWVDKVVKPWAESKQGRPTIVILDEFSAYLTTPTRRARSVLGCHLVTIPDGYTWRLQVMDVELNKPFKDGLRDQFNIWQSASVDVNDKPQRYNVAKCNKASFSRLKQQSIFSTWI